MSFVSLVRWGWRNRHKKNKAIITYNVNAPHGLSTILAARAVHTKAFAIIADLPVPGHGIVPSTMLRRVEFSLQVKSLRRFDGLIVLTRDIARDFAPQVPFLIMEGAVDGPLMESCSEESPLRQADKFVLMYAGLLSEFDGVPLLLEAFSLLEGDRYRLIIVGRGPEQARVERETGKDHRISYEGYLRHEQVLKLYGRADLLINPRPSAPLSTHYVFPSKLIEYLATGTPVITTATADVVEEYGDFAFVLHDETPVGLAELVRQIASLPESERSARGHAARQYMLKNKTWAIQGQRIAEFVRERLDPLTA